MQPCQAISKPSMQWNHSNLGQAVIRKIIWTKLAQITWNKWVQPSKHSIIIILNNQIPKIRSNQSKATDLSMHLKVVTQQYQSVLQTKPKQDNNHENHSNHEHSTHSITESNWLANWREEATESKESYLKNGTWKLSNRAERNWVQQETT